MRVQREIDAAERYISCRAHREIGGAARDRVYREILSVQRDI